MTNLCRCGTYQRVRAAIHRASIGMATGMKKTALKETSLQTGGAA
jgi:aerobic-type carbon monoxide dehydrogenase small subunit (CoxS/CutS family)